MESLYEPRTGRFSVLNQILLENSTETAVVKAIESTSDAEDVTGMQELWS